MLVCHACGTGRRVRVLHCTPHRLGPSMLLPGGPGHAQPLPRMPAAHFGAAPTSVGGGHHHTHTYTKAAAQLRRAHPSKLQLPLCCPQCPQQFPCLVSPPPQSCTGQQGWWFSTRRPPSSFHRFAACLLGPLPQAKRYRFARNKRRPAASSPPAHNNWPPPHPSVSSLCTAGAPPAPYAHHPGPHTTRPPPFSAAPSWPATAGPGRWPGAPPAGTPAG